MQLESRAETDGVVAVYTAAVHGTVVEGSAPRAVSTAMRRRPIPIGKPFVSIITLRNS